MANNITVSLDRIADQVVDVLTAVIEEKPGDAPVALVLLAEDKEAFRGWVLGSISSTPISNIEANIGLGFSMQLIDHLAEASGEYDRD